MMPYCPECGKKFPDDFSRCPDCGVQLVDSPAPDEFDDESDFNFEPVLLCQTNDLVSAEILEAALKTEGIPCLVKSNMGSFSSLIPIDQVMKGVKFYVPESALKRALEIAETIIPNFERTDEED
jgi:hypothetical protein